jgi:hypothetical protein
MGSLGAERAQIGDDRGRLIVGEARIAVRRHKQHTFPVRTKTRADRPVDVRVREFLLAIVRFGA